VVRGGAVIDPGLVDALVRGKAAIERSALADLSPRERQVLAEIAQGKSNAAIAGSLVLSKGAVEKHINAIFLKLGLAFAEDVSKRVKAALMFLSESELPVPAPPP
jgi:DNA-binding NarL/FixJ family response regulator